MSHPHQRSKTPSRRTNTGPPSFGMGAVSGVPRQEGSLIVSQEQVKKEDEEKVLNPDGTCTPDGLSTLDGSGTPDDTKRDGEVLPLPPAAVKMNSKYADMFGGGDTSPPPAKRVSRAKESLTLPAPGRPKTPSRLKPISKPSGFGMSAPRVIHRTLPKKGFGLQAGGLGDYN